MTDAERLDFLESLVGRHVMTPCHKNKHQPTGMRKDYCGADLHVIHDHATIFIRGETGHSTVSASAPTFREAIDDAAEQMAGKRRENANLVRFPA